MDGVKELIDLTNQELGENTKYVAKELGKGYRLKKRWGKRMISILFIIDIV